MGSGVSTREGHKTVRPGREAEKGMTLAKLPSKPQYEITSLSSKVWQNLLPTAPRGLFWEEELDRGGWIQGERSLVVYSECTAEALRVAIQPRRKGSFYKGAG